MDLPKFHPNERVDLADVEFLSDGVLGEFQRTLVNLVTGEATMRILDGFGWTIVGVDVLTITFGKALAAENRLATVRYGQLLGGGSPLEGVASQNVSFAGLAVTTWGVYVRFTSGDGAVENRAFWDAILDVEDVQTVATRRVAAWQATVAQTSPGAEWYRVLTVAWDGADLATSTLVDRRNYLFEGPADSSPAFSSTWGGGNDRNANRALYGTKTLERFVAAVTKKLEEIQTGDNTTEYPSFRWWQDTPDSLDNKVSLNGTGAKLVQNTIQFDDGVYALWGASLTTFARINNAVGLEMIGGLTISQEGLLAGTGHSLSGASPRTVYTSSTDVYEVQRMQRAGSLATHFVTTDIDHAGAGIVTHDIGAHNGSALGQYRWTFEGAPDPYMQLLRSAFTGGLATLFIKGGVAPNEFAAPHTFTLGRAAAFGAWHEVYANDVIPPGATHGGRLGLSTARYDAFLKILNVSTTGAEGVGSNLLPTATSTHTVGSSSRRFQAGWFDNVVTTTLLWSEADAQVDGGLECDDIQPIVSAGSSLGSSGNQYAQAYVTTMNATTVRPISAGIGDLGQVANRWDFLHVENVRAYATDQDPTSQAQLIEINQRKCVLVAGRVEAAGAGVAPTVQTPHYNISGTGVPASPGRWVITFDVNINLEAAFSATITTTSAYGVRIRSSGAAQVTVQIYDLATGSDAEPAAGSAFVSIIAVGSPETIQT